MLAAFVVFLTQSQELITIAYLLSVNTVLGSRTHGSKGECIVTMKQRYISSM